MACVKNRSTEEGRKFWNHVERIARAVREKQADCVNHHIKGEHCGLCGWKSGAARNNENETEKEG